MAITERFRNLELIPSDTVDGHKITPHSFGNEFIEGHHRFKQFTLSHLELPATKLYIKGDVDDDWVEVTQLLSNGAATWLVYGIDYFYLKADNGSGKISIIAYITDARNSGY